MGRTKEAVLGGPADSAPASRGGATSRPRTAVPIAGWCKDGAGTCRGPRFSGAASPSLWTTRVCAAMSPRRCPLPETITAIDATRYENIPSTRRRTVLVVAARTPGTSRLSSRTTFIPSSILPQASFQENAVQDNEQPVDRGRKGRQRSAPARDTFARDGAEVPPQSGAPGAHEKAFRRAAIPVERRAVVCVSGIPLSSRYRSIPNRRHTARWRPSSRAKAA